MSKKYKGKTCVYCGKRKSSSSGDHVIAREFFPFEERVGIPIVPCCDKCNNDKSAVEHYTTTVLPFGSNTYYAGHMLQKYVAKRLERNRRLKKNIRRLAGRTWVKKESGLFVQTMTLPIEAEQIIELLKYIVKGLMYYNWNYILPSDYVVNIRPVTEEQMEYFRTRVLSMSRDNYIHRNYGKGCLIYHCTRSSEDPGISVWEINFYNGLVMTGEQGGRIKRVYFSCWTGPKRILDAT